MTNTKPIYLPAVIEQMQKTFPDIDLRILAVFTEYEQLPFRNFYAQCYKVLSEHSPRHTDVEVSGEEIFLEYALVHAFIIAQEVAQKKLLASVGHKLFVFLNERCAGKKCYLVFDRTSAKLRVDGEEEISETDTIYIIGRKK